MGYRCPYCGVNIHEEIICPQCEQKIDWVYAIFKRSDFYYNKGYTAAVQRNLSEAITNLCKAIGLNKYHTTARNLLGLVYYEVGKVSLALKEWIISNSLEKGNELASYYIEQVQKSPKKLQAFEEAIQLYNKAIRYLHQDNSDVAIIRLKKAVALNPKLVEARVLLGLCYMREEQLYKADEQITEALKSDAGHPVALQYYRLLSGEDKGDIKPYQVDYTQQKIGGGKVHKVSSLIDRGSLFTRYVLYFALGAIAMGIVCYALVLPNKIQNYVSDIARLNAAKLELETSSLEQVKKYEQQLAVLNEDNALLRKEVEGYEIQTSEYIQKDKISLAKEYISQNEYVLAAEQLYNVATTFLNQADKQSYEGIKTDCYARASNALLNEGYDLLKQSSYVEAKEKLEKALLYEPEEQVSRKGLYYLGQIEVALNNPSVAKNYFQKVVEDYPDTNEAWWASSELEKLETTASQ